MLNQTIKYNSNDFIQYYWYVTRLLHAVLTKNNM